MESKETLKKDSERICGIIEGNITLLNTAIESVQDELSKLSKSQQIYIVTNLKNIAETEDCRRVADILYDRIIWGN